MASELKTMHDTPFIPTGFIVSSKPSAFVISAMPIYSISGSIYTYSLFSKSNFSAVNSLEYLLIILSGTSIEMLIRAYPIPLFRKASVAVHVISGTNVM